MSKDRLNPGWPVLTNLRNLLPLDDDSLQQIIDYSVSLPREQAAEHLKGILGDGSDSLSFISSFNAKRVSAPPSVPEIVQPAADHVPKDGSIAPVPKTTGPRKGKKKFAELNKLPPPRQVENRGNLQGAYLKHEEDDFIKAARRDRAPRNSLGISSSPSSQDVSPAPSKAVTPARQPSPAPPSSTVSGKLPPSAAGALISDPPKSKAAKPKSTKVTITGGTPMQGASTALSDLDSAIRALEIQTNPTLAPSARDNERRRCGCMATRHPLLAAAPNCLHCGKIICVKEGIGPCTFCGSPLLDAESVDAMIRVLRDERGREKQAAGNAAYRRAEVSRTPKPFSVPVPEAGGEGADGGLSAAKLHRDKLLAFQAQNARRTRIHDEAADFETPTAGLNIWASPVERAMQLKMQQKALREQEWNARPEWEKKKVVTSIDIVGGKAVKKYTRVEVDREREPASEDDGIEEEESSQPLESKGMFGRNPLLGGLIRPVAKDQEKGKGPASKESANRWRRVQDDDEDNERWILDGGTLGRGAADVGNTDEPPCG